MEIIGLLYLSYYITGCSTQTTIKKKTFDSNRKFCSYDECIKHDQKACLFTSPSGETISGVYRFFGSADHQGLYITCNPKVGEEEQIEEGERLERQIEEERLRQRMEDDGWKGRQKCVNDCWDKKNRCIASSCVGTNDCIICRNLFDRCNESCSNRVF